MYNYKPKFEVGKTYALRNINFDLDKYILLPQSYVELNNLLQVLHEYPKMCVKIFFVALLIITQTYCYSLVTRNIINLIEVITNI
jgi:hypothetical protein